MLGLPEMALLRVLPFIAPHFPLSIVYKRVYANWKPPVAGEILNQFEANETGNRAGEWKRSGVPW
jgi:hypothetical protein